MSKAAIARSEGVSKVSVSESIKRGLCSIEKFLKSFFNTPYFCLFFVLISKATLTSCNFVPWQLNIRYFEYESLCGWKAKQHNGQRHDDKIEQSERWNAAIKATVGMVERWHTSGIMILSHDLPQTWGGVPVIFAASWRAKADRYCGAMMSSQWQLKISPFAWVRGK